MEDSILDLLMYLDEGLVKNLSSMILSGYIEIRTTKIIQDRTLSGRAGTEYREHYFDEDRCGEDEREGYKGSNCSKAEHKENTNRNDMGLENREFIRREEELKRVYTTFTLHRELITELNTKNLIREFDNKTIQEDDVKPGDYIKIHGKLTSESVDSYLDSLLTIFNSFGCDSLDSLIKKSEVGVFNFKKFNHILSHLNEILNKNNTHDMILNCGETPVILNVNSNFFMNQTSYIYNIVNCPCTVFGKVINIAPNGQCVSLLRKTAQQDYYEHLLKNCHEHCSILKSNGINMPDIPRLKCEGVSLVILPISICL